MMDENNEKGFTLIEVLTVVVIVGILSSLAVTSFLENIRRERVKLGTDEVHSFLQRTTLEMRKMNADRSIYFSKTKAQVFEGDSCKIGNEMNALSLQDNVEFGTHWSGSAGNYVVTKKTGGSRSHNKCVQLDASKILNPYPETFILYLKHNSLNGSYGERIRSPKTQNNLTKEWTSDNGYSSFKERS